MVILAECKTKLKARVAYEQKWDTLSGLFEKKTDHIFAFGFKHVVGIGEACYNKILESFQANKLGNFAKVVEVNLPHKRLPRLVLVVCCTCNSFNRALVRN